MAELATACSLWQECRDASSLLRAAARCLTGEPHYFKAGFIDDYERRAREDHHALEAAQLLLSEIQASPRLTAADWCRLAGLPEVEFAGRGLKEKPDEDPQIRARLKMGQIVMPLWGVSLARDVALSYGGRWLFQLRGTFPGVAAWMHSGRKPEEQEIITGGRYQVLAMQEDNGTTVVQLCLVGQ